MTQSIGSRADDDEPATSIQAAAAALRDGRCTSASLVRMLLDRADRLDSRLGVYLARFDSSAIEAAEQADRELASGLDRGLLHGIPVGIKDVLASREGPTTAQSLVLDRAWGKNRDAQVVARLRNAGAVILGKTTTMEFACGLPDPTSPFPLPRNPWDLDCWAGGSSSGSASGVASGFMSAAIGTDTAGSIRMPAAWCGVTGLKPTYGLVSTAGSVPCSYTLDHVGPIAHTARDCALILRCIGGRVPTSLSAYLSQFDGDLRGLRIGVERIHHFPADADPRLASCFGTVLEALQDRGAELVELELPLFSQLRAATVVTFAGEAYAYHHNDLQERWNEFGSATRSLIVQGAFVSSGDYVQAQRVRRAAQRELTHSFASIDAAVMPTTAAAAARVEDVLQTDGAGQRKLQKLIFTSIWNAVGWPALSVPMGFTSGGLPLGFQVVAPPFADETALKIGDAFQQASDWHLKAPPLSMQEQPRLGTKIGGGHVPFRPNDVTHVRRVLSDSRIPASEDELLQLATTLLDLRTDVESLYGVDAARCELPATEFTTSLTRTRS